MSKKIQIPDFFAIAEGIKTDARRYAKVFCLQWFDDSFQNQGFTDSSFQAWEKRKEPDRRSGGAILVDTTFLRKSLAVLAENRDKIQFGTHAPYASLHNNGERMRVVQNVRAHSRTRKGKREQVKAHKRKIDTRYPKRQFIGKSEKMMSELDKWLLNQISIRFKQQ
ncbi:MAG: phage virion morphogenesis protein [Flavobacterium nitrogenifigens]|uniref:phage virion morphogenesis protein n=1 Tax=Flavobacterium nitrogenifigens TaxID=1617283 RepID=UPI0028068FDA|nr:phage virion morphogenesis protein [Flavobacterium nitrogenifigens]MDQ8012027.1 phage virion morphogenesis protein [Flavobacterium nitrogenifigens]